MASFLYTHAAAEILRGHIEFDADDIRCLLVMTNTTADTELDDFSEVTTLDEMDGANYSSPGIALTSEAVTDDDANDRGEFDATDITWSSLGAGTRNVQAAIVYLFVTNLNGSMPIAYIDTGGFPFAATGSDITIQWNAEGILQLATAA